MNGMTFTDMNSELVTISILSVLAFVFAMFLTPFYTFAAYRYRFWKKQRTDSTTGEKLEVFTKLHAGKFKRKIPTMAGIIAVISIFVVTFFFNLDRAETWLPLAALIGGGIVGMIDDLINIRGQGIGVAGLRSSLKFLMITALGATLGWFFYFKLGYDAVYVPFLGDIALGWLIIPLFVLAVVSTSNAVNISDGLDGLAGGLLMSSYSAFGVIALSQVHM